MEILSLRLHLVMKVMDLKDFPIMDSKDLTVDDTWQLYRAAAELNGRFLSIRFRFHRVTVWTLPTKYSNFKKNWTWHLYQFLPSDILNLQVERKIFPTCRSEMAMGVSKTVQITSSLQSPVVNEPLYRKKLSVLSGRRSDRGTEYRNASLFVVLASTILSNCSRCRNAMLSLSCS